MRDSQWLALILCLWLFSLWLQLFNIYNLLEKCYGLLGGK